MFSAFRRSTRRPTFGRCFSTQLFPTAVANYAYHKPLLGAFYHLSQQNTSIPSTRHHVLLQPYKIHDAPLTKRHVLYEILKTIQPDALLLLLVATSALLTAAMGLLAPKATGDLVERIAKGLTSKSADLVKLLKEPALRLLGIYSLQGLLTFANISLVAILGERVAYRLKLRLFEACLLQDMVFFDKHRVGEVLNRLTSDISEFKSTFKATITQGLKSSILVTGGLVQLFTLSAPLTLTLASTIPVSYLLLSIYAAYLRRLARRSKLVEATTAGIANEVLSNVRTVRAFHAEDYEIDHYRVACNEVQSANEHLGFHIGVFQGLTNVTIGGMVLVVLYRGGQLILDNQLTSGALITYLVSIQTMQKAFVSLGTLFGQVNKASSAAYRIFEFMHIRPSIPISGGHVYSNVKGSIEFRNVDFNYPMRPEHPVLRNFNLYLPAGKTVALCGESGQGKSTVAQLLVRFYDIHGGEILIDGHELRTLDPGWWREQVGFISQEPVLFSGTLLDNVTYGHEVDMNNKALWTKLDVVARQANVHDVVSKMGGWMALVGERGATLSGGQRQRISIARALFKDPSILLLDEATSALDTESERVVQEALERLMHNRTVLIIAHRLSTIRNADWIVVFGDVDGNILEQGTHDTLIQKRGAYYRLYHQMENNDVLNTD
jgi:ATP-binding cassette subfamily B (MDR/TAP) protein 8